MRVTFSRGRVAPAHRVSEDLNSSPTWFRSYRENRLAIGTEAFVLPRPFGPYTLTRRIAVGGMAEVYVAKTQGISGFEKRLAIKVIHPSYSEDEEFVTMLVEEAKLSVLLSHNNVVQTFDLGHVEDTYFIAMEFVEGADCLRILKALRQRSALLPVDVCAYLVASVCSALDYAHRKRDRMGNPLRIVHRDVSPQNVLVSFSGDVKLADFGIAKAAQRTQQTQVGAIKGNHRYMSPEQAGGGVMDHRSDIFSAGLVLHELLTREPFYRGDSLPERLDPAHAAKVRPPSFFRRDVAVELDVITMKALAHRPDDRYESAHDFGQALTEFLYQHNPSFTNARVSRLMAQLFPEEYVASTGAQAPTQAPLWLMSTSVSTGQSDDGAPSVALQSTSLPFERDDKGDSLSLDGHHLGEDEATLVEDQSLAARLDAHVDSQPPAAPGPSSIPKAPRLPREARASDVARRGVAARPRTRQPLFDAVRWFVIAGLVGVVTYLLIGTALRPDSVPVVQIDSAPRGAAVRLDGQLLGAPTPARVDGLVVGHAHTLEVHLEGYEPFSTRLRVQPGEQELVALLVRLGRDVMVVSDPPGAEVSCDGVAQGRTPLSIGRREVGDVLNVTVTIEGREPVTHRLEVADGEGPQTLRVSGGG